MKSSAILLPMLALTSCASPVNPAANIGSSTINVGQAALQAGNPQITVSVADAILKKDPKDANAWVLKSTALYQMDNMDGAQQAAENALALAPDNVGANMVLGRAVAVEDPQQALRAFTRAYNADTSNNDAATNMAIANIQLGNIDKGIEILQRVHDANPNDNTVTYNLALALTVRNKGNDAIRGAMMLKPLAADPKAAPEVVAAYAFAASTAGMPQ